MCGFFPTLYLTAYAGQLRGVWQYGYEAAIYADYELTCHYVQ